MSIYNQNEEKIVLNDDMHDEKYSPFYNLTPIDYRKVWMKTTQRAESYARTLRVDNSWFESDFNNSDHERLGLGLRIVNTNINWANIRNE